MKIYLFALAGLLLAFGLIGPQWVEHYKPAVAVLERTTVITGKVLYSSHHLGPLAEVNGLPFTCRMNFLSATEACPDRVPGLPGGTEVTVAVAYVPAMARTVELAMSIRVHGKDVYTATPQQVIADYMQSSRTGLLHCASWLVFLLFVMPLMFSTRFKEALAALFD